MIVQPDGDFQIKPGEVVTFTITAINTVYLAIPSRLRQATWQIVAPPHSVGPNTTQEMRRFQAGLTTPDVESTTIIFDFIRNAADVVPPGAQYVVDVQGSNGAFVARKVILPIPPFPVDRHFMFEVLP